MPEGVAEGGGRRGARLGVHGNRAARRAVGLEAALVDHSTLSIIALDPADARSFDVEVAGVAALLIAKAHNIRDRLGSSRPDRAADKDAVDIYRLMQSSLPGDVGVRFAELRRDPIAGPVTETAIAALAELFQRRNSAGVGMAVRALRLAIPEDQVATLATSYTERMLASLEDERA